MVFLPPFLFDFLQFRMTVSDGITISISFQVEFTESLTTDVRSVRCYGSIIIIMINVIIIIILLLLLLLLLLLSLLLLLLLFTFHYVFPNNLHIFITVWATLFVPESC